MPRKRSRKRGSHCYYSETHRRCHVCRVKTCSKAECSRLLAHRTEVTLERQRGGMRLAYAHFDSIGQPVLSFCSPICETRWRLGIEHAPPKPARTATK